MPRLAVFKHGDDRLIKLLCFRLIMNTLDKQKNRQINIFIICAVLHYLWLAKVLLNFESELKEYGFMPILLFILVLVVLAHFTERLISHLLYWLSVRK